MADFNDELTLIKIESGTTDEIGNPITVESSAIVLCGVKSVTRAEFWGSAQTNMKPEIVFEVYPYDYDGETIVEFAGVRYSVIRSFRNNHERMELVCERKVRDG